MHSGTQLPSSWGWRDSCCNPKQFINKFSSNSDAPRNGIRCKALSGSLRNHGRLGCETSYDELPDLILFRKIGISNCRAVVLAFEVVHMIRDQVEVEAASSECGSRYLVLHFVQKSLSLFAWKEFEEP